MEELKSILLALVGGARYGTKIRLPHAAIMTFLFKRNLSSHQKLHLIFRLVREHASNLAVFAAIYKSLLAILKWNSRREEGATDKNNSVLQMVWRTLLSIGKRM